MKKIYVILLLISSGGAHAAITPTTLFGDTMSGGIIPNYLVGAADAWFGVMPGVFGSGAMSAKLAELHAGDITAFRDSLATLAYNDSALTVTEISQHIDNSFYVISGPMMSRRTNCVWENGKCNVQKNGLLLDVYGYGGFTEYDNNKYNSAFETARWGVSVNAAAFLSESLVLGLGYTRSMGKTDDSKTYDQTTSDSMTVFLEYLAKSGAFINTGFTIGRTDWETTKYISTLDNNSDVSSGFWAGQLNTGIEFQRGAMFITPQVGLRYAQMSTDQHTDSALQTFDKWDYNDLSGMAEIELGGIFTGGDVTFRPSVFVMGGYNFLTGGDDMLHVTLVDSSSYYIPVDNMTASTLGAGLNFGISALFFEINLEYRLDLKQNYVSHNGFVNLKMAF